MDVQHRFLDGSYLTISNKWPLSNRLSRGSQILVWRILRQATVFNRHSLVLAVHSSTLLLTLSLSHSPTLCQTTTPPSKTPIPRSVLWMGRRPGWTVRLHHTGHEFILDTVCQSECRVCERLCWEAEGVLHCDVI